MVLPGVHWLDLVILAIYFAGMLAIGRYAARRMHGQRDFYLAGRKLGRTLQFFLNFGNMTDANGAATTSSVVYSQGVGGVWLSLQTLFMTPYYWFMNRWFRRARLVTMADLFEDRFGGQFLSRLYAISTIFFGILGMGGSYLITLKMTEILMVKPPQSYSMQERKMVEGYTEYKVLEQRFAEGKLAETEKERLTELRDLKERRQIRSFISWARPGVVYVSFAVLVGTYIILGGMMAAALTDAMQGILIVIFSCMLIPFGIARLGGFEAFREKIPASMVELFGNGATTEFAWYSVAAILWVAMIQIHGLGGNMATAGSAEDESAAAIGAVTGGFLKRLMIIAWSFCGLIAFALFGNSLSDPDIVWGNLSSALLGPGMLGLMMAGIMAASMSTKSTSCLNISALVVRNILPFVVPDISPRAELAIARILIAVTLGLGIVAAYFIRDILFFVKMSLTLYVAFGAVVFLIFKWRRLTKTAAIVGVIVSTIFIVIVPLGGSYIPWISGNPGLTIQTRETVGAHGKIVPAKPIYFDALVRDKKKGNALNGIGRFNIELLLLSACGVDLREFTPAALLAAIFFIDGLLPFIVMAPLSFLTRDGDPERTRRFYVKMRTVVRRDPDEDAHALAEALMEEGSRKEVLLMPGTFWEIYRPTRGGAIGFGICCAAAAIILIFFQSLLGYFRQ